MYKRLNLAALAIVAAFAPLQTHAVDLRLSTSQGDCFLPLQAGSAVGVDPNNGNVLAVLSSTFNPGDAGCAALGQPAQAPSFTTPLRVNGAASFTFASATAGQVSLTWASQNAAYCENSGSVLPTSVTNWPAVGTIMPIERTSGSPLNVTIPSNTSTSQRVYTFGLRCVGIVAPATSNSTVQVTVPPGDGGGNPEPTGCEGVTGPAGFTRLGSTTIRFSSSGTVQNVNGEVFEQVFKEPASNTLWPGNQSTRYLRIAANRYASMGPFTVTQITNWRINTEQGIEAGGRAFFAVSRCPHDFRVSGPDAIDSRCRLPSPEVVATQFHVPVTNPAAYTGSACPLKIGDQYYLNVIFADPYNGFAKTPGCESTTCNWFVTSLHAP